jgi:hypothetical protein
MPRRRFVSTISSQHEAQMKGVEGMPTLVNTKPSSRRRRSSPHRRSGC